MLQQASHENLTPNKQIKINSNKSFGLVFALVFLLIGLWPLLDNQPIRLWACGGFCVLILISFTIPKILGPFNHLWFLFGLLLHKFLNPIIMGLLFFTTITPIALTMRLLGKRPLSLEFDPKVNSYWIKRDPPGPDPKSMTRQF